ncbi:unnamed protein product, partial [Hapterophycus canaliculatus]
MARLGCLAAACGRSCLRRFSERVQGPSPFSGAKTHRQSRALHYTRSTLKDYGDTEQNANMRAGPESGTTDAAPDSPAEDADGAGMSLSTSTALARVGRGCLLALPLAGAGAAAWVGRSDYHKVRQELRLARVRLALDHMNHQREVNRTAGQRGVERPTRPTLDTSTARYYAGALLADSGVLAAHLVAAYGLYRGWDPEPIVNAEIASLVGAVLSTGGGVRGEYLIAARKAAQESDNGSSGDGGSRGASTGGGGAGGG